MLLEGRHVFSVHIGGETTYIDIIPTRNYDMPNIMNRKSDIHLHETIQTISKTI